MKQRYQQEANANATVLYVLAIVFKERLCHTTFLSREVLQIFDGLVLIKKP